MAELVYEDTPRYDLWLKLILGSVLALTLILGFVLLPTDIVAACVMLGVTLFDALLFRAILPRRFQIFQDRVKIVLGGPLALSIPLSDISEVRSASASKVFVYWGHRFATSTRGIVEVVRKKGLSLVISPANADTFLEQLNQALGGASNSS
jgi:hypothetical protein